MKNFIATAMLSLLMAACASTVEEPSVTYTTLEELLAKENPTLEEQALIKVLTEDERSKPFGCVQVVVEGGTVTCCSTDTTTCCATPNHGAECSP